MKTINAADLFCGAGGTSTGLHMAAQNLGFHLKLLAINHWNVAISTHSTNHPWADHLCESMDNVDPRKVVPGGQLDLLVASPECTHHSRARGGKPISDQSRSSAWHVLRWAEALYIENILIENVPEFMDWGPIDKDNQPVQKLKGKTFLAFLEALRSLGYNVDYRVLNAADFGDPTTRKRLFIMARREKPVLWPDPSFSKEGGKDLFSQTKPWRPARDIIDWAAGNMNWDDVKDVAVEVPHLHEKVDYQEGWVNGEKDIV
jgi:DNA (cytosine-5)-methyltransferase 1